MNILILEDEPLIAQRLQRMLRELLPASIDYHIQCTHHLDKALTVVTSMKVDLCFLDLNLSGQSGFDLLENTKCRFHTVVTSAYTEKAIDAFRWGVLDFVPKPFVKDRLKKALQRYLQQSQRQESLLVSSGASKKVIPLDQISYIKAAGNYTQVTCANNDQFLAQETIGQLAEWLSGSFIRLHKSYLVPKARISELKNYGSGKCEVVLAGGKVIPVSRNVFPRLKEIFVR